MEDRRVTIHEVGPRDGLQNEPGVVPPEARLDWIAALADAGLREIEVGSFVSPKWVPQMAGSGDLLAALPPRDGVTYAVLVPNMRGWEGLAAVNRLADTKVAVFISASEGFSRANLNCSVAESVERLRPVVAAAVAAGVPVRGYVSCVTDCPFDGPVPPGRVARAVAMLREVAEMPVSLGDTIGRGTPERVDAMLAAVLEEAPATDLAGHFHDTSGLALENVAVSLGRGLRDFDGAAGGLGGCPYAPGAPGNLATEALVGFLHDRGSVTGVDEAALSKAAEMGQRIRSEARDG